MAYTRWQADWKNDAIGGTPIVEGFLDQVESTLVSQDGRLTTLESGSAGSTIATKTTDYTILATDHTILADAGSGSLTITLLTAISRSGTTYQVKRISSGVNTVTVATTAGQVIDGAATQVLANQYDSLTVVSNGSQWFIV